MKISWGKLLLMAVVLLSLASLIQSLYSRGTFRVDTETNQVMVSYLHQIAGIVRQHGSMAASEFCRDNDLRQIVTKNGTRFIRCTVSASYVVHDEKSHPAFTFPYILVKDETIFFTNPNKKFEIRMVDVQVFSFLRKNPQDNTEHFGYKMLSVDL